MEIWTASTTWNQTCFNTDSVFLSQFKNYSQLHRDKKAQKIKWPAGRMSTINKDVMDTNDTEMPQSSTFPGKIREESGTSQYLRIL